MEKKSFSLKGEDRRNLWIDQWRMRMEKFCLRGVEEKMFDLHGNGRCRGGLGEEERLRIEL